MVWTGLRDTGVGVSGCDYNPSLELQITIVIGWLEYILDRQVSQVAYQVLAGIVGKREPPVTDYGRENDTFEWERN